MPRDVVERLHRIRLDRDLSYEALATELDMSRVHLFRLMTTKGIRATDRTIARLRRYIATADAREKAS